MDKHKVVKVGVIHGRFQLLHLEHVEYLLAAKQRCEFLYICITNITPLLSKQFEGDLNRTSLKANPFTYYERLDMVRDAMLSHGIPRNEFEIVPLPIRYPETYSSFVPLDATFYTSIYDDWGRKKVEIFKALHLKVEVLWDRDISEKKISGSYVRDLIAHDNEWKHLVPKSTYDYVINNNLVQRIRDTFGVDQDSE